MSGPIIQDASTLRSFLMSSTIQDPMEPIGVLCSTSWVATLTHSGVSGAPHGFLRRLCGKWQGNYFQLLTLCIKAVVSSTQASVRANSYHTSTDNLTDIKPTNILLDLSSHHPELQQVDWIQLYFDKVPIPTGIAYPDFDHVQTRAVYMPVTDETAVDIRLADFGSACWEEKRLSETIQPELLRAPEIYELLTAKHLFHGNNLNDHLRQMEMLLGPFPHSFIGKARFEGECFTPDGLVKNATNYEDTTLEDTVSETLLSEEERHDFLSFLRSMLKYEPDERATAQQLLGHPWLVKDYDYPSYECY
ncbi:MAG: hypothetical protein Q9226_009281 [Calogaya cf. arnoldii]